MTKEELEKKAEDFAIIECCSTCSIKNPYSCEEKCECWIFATEGVKFGYDKANEWHYVKNEKPKDDGNFICMLENGYKLECYYDPTNKRWYDNFFHHDTEYGYYQSKVIAWKEIVPPKGSVINDYS